jgi:drug/metabolite transporter (DMT)-like permease
MCSATLFFALLDTINKVLVRTLPPMEVIWGRNLAQFVLMTAVLAPHMRFRLVRTRHPLTQFWRGVALFASSAFAVTALKVLPLADAMAFANTQVLMVTALSGPLLGERIGIRRWVAVGAGFVGVLIVAGPAGEGSLFGAACMLGAALSMAFYMILTRTLGLDEGPVASLYLSCLISLALLSASVPFVWEPLHSWWEVGGLATAGVLGGTGHYLFTRAFATAPASTLAPFAYTSLIWGSLSSVFVFGDPLAWSTVLGIVVIAGADLYAGYRERAEARGGT